MHHENQSDNFKGEDEKPLWIGGTSESATDANTDVCGSPGSIEIKII